VTSLCAALGLLRTHRRLWRYVVVPILVNLAVAAILYATLATIGLRAIERAIGEGQAVTIMLQALVVIALFIVIGFLLARFGIVLGAPWYAKLSEEIELLRTGVDPPSRPALADLARAAVHEARKLALIVATSLALLAVNFVPVAGQLVGTAGGFLLGATVACLDFFDGPLDRAGLSFAQKLRYIARTAPASLGFGLACAVLIAIPLVNLLCLPLCMVAGTIFVTDRPATAGTPRPEAA
jgi:CysZ protein